MSVMLGTDAELGKLGAGRCLDLTSTLSGDWFLELCLTVSHSLFQLSNSFYRLQ